MQERRSYGFDGARMAAGPTSSAIGNRSPVPLAPSLTLRGGFAVVRNRHRFRNNWPLVERIDVDRRETTRRCGQYRRDVDAAPATDEEIGGPQPEAIDLEQRIVVHS